MLNYRKDILSTVFDNYDKFYMHVAPLEDVIIGKRGLLNQESEQGIVLVFGKSSYKDFEWDEKFIYTTMKFGGAWEHLMIPINGIKAIFDDPVNPEFIFNFKVLESNTLNDTEKVKKKPQTIKDGNVISLDFGKKNNED